MNFPASPNFYYYVTLGGFFGLFALLMLWPTLLAPSSRLPVALLLIVTVTPLLVPMRGLLYRCRKSCAWAAFLSLFYFIHGCVETYANSPERLFAASEILLSLLLFLGATGYIRYSRNST